MVSLYNFLFITGKFVGESHAVKKNNTSCVSYVFEKIPKAFSVLL